MFIPNLPSFLEIHFLTVDYSYHFINTMLMEYTELPHTLNQAVLKRKCEFLAGRVCAQRGLNKLMGSRVVSIKIGEHRQPMWPTGIVGSISHCLGYAVSAVGFQSDECISVGIDIEKVITTQFAKEITNQVLSEGEMVFAEQFDEFQSFLTLVFSAKESIYKAIFPFVKQVLDFDCVQLITVDQKQKTLQFQFSPFLLEVLNSRVTVNYHFCQADTVATWCLLSTNHLHFRTMKDAVNLID
ncbi:4'-phosphopantetheinyl transferase superfamily protein [Vibrio metschnikovii]|uniref:4'-phosphopantetheinyl transferase family protein n=1 Tax=Vibrio metschnikovii TaxID=28172 RepID=UPI0013020C7A|nr:4'-phosphopantetheinyl transferase superfamily protein [Vibrio metschnikovii]EKO3577889.1 4'-phosphopantetheinyl transferase superfamily protein [Vibrio metschnikovii]EKO3672454.1 4'-phosphopantetheinyl transferase superfamily protein [Vibrio metschnikovii]EKO3774455.1 4'-phosphopantetheinyl transferase superfamily protein [Vibrio metschnikovii]